MSLTRLISKIWKYHHLLTHSLNDKEWFYHIWKWYQIWTHGGHRLINKDTEVSFFSGGKNKRKLIDPPSLPFLAVQNSSIGERVPHSVSQSLSDFFFIFRRHCFITESFEGSRLTIPSLLWSSFLSGLQQPTGPQQPTLWNVHATEPQRSLQITITWSMQLRATQVKRT